MNALNDTHRNHLRQNTCFSLINDKAFNQLFEQASVKLIRKKNFLFRQNRPATQFFCLLSGKIKLVLRSENGAEKVLRIITPTDFFADTTLFSLDGTVHPSDAVALIDCEVVALPTSALLHVMENHLDFHRFFMQQMGQSLHRLVNEIEQLTIRSAQYRLVSYLLTQLHSQHSGNGNSLVLPEAKNLIASQLSIQPESFSRILNTLAKNELITVDGRHINVVDQRRLHALLHE